MNTHNTQPKKEADNLTKLSIFYLNQQGLLKQGTRSRILTWQRNSLGHKTSRSINLTTTITNEHQTVTVRYVLEKRGTRKDFAYNINLTTTPCNLGGERYWFTCPVPHCNKRVGMLYIAGDTFTCRHCCNLTYKSKKENRYHSLYWVLQQHKLSRQIDELEPTIKRPFYAGQPTKKQRKLNEMYLRLFAFS